MKILDIFKKKKSAAVSVGIDQKEKPKRVEEKKTEEKKEVEEESPKLKSKNIRSSSPTELPHEAKVKKKAKLSLPSAAARVVKEDKSSSPPLAAARVVKEDKSSSPPLAAARVKEVRFERSYKILKGPHVTEKAGDLTEKNQYVFRIFPRTNKTEVKKAIENAYGVDVVSVKIINVPEKKRKLGKIQGTKPGYKKAIVKIKKGQKIEVLPR